MSDGKPNYVVRAAKNVKGEKKWTDIGVAYTNAQGFVTVYLTALPLNDKIVLIPVKGG